MRHNGESILEMREACVMSYMRCRYIFSRTQLHEVFRILSNGPFCLTERAKRRGGVKFL